MLPGLLSKIYPDCASVSPQDSLVRSGESLLPQLMERVMEGELFIIDCGANTGPGWEALFKVVWPTLADEMNAKGVKWTIIVPITSAEETLTNFALYKKQYPRATFILCVVREYADEEVPLPDHPKDLVIELPLAPGKLFSSYRKLRMPIDNMIGNTALPMLSGFAKGYIPQLHAMFKRIEPHLIP
jgi:hypothetical protein